MDTVFPSEATMNALPYYHSGYVCMAIQHPSFWENTAPPSLQGNSAYACGRYVTRTWLIKILHYPEHSCR